ncbi:MAG: hypothetical protein ACR2KG_00595 [Nocardioidaceae bacterium]
MTNVAKSLPHKRAIKDDPDDPVDLAEIRAIQQDKAALHEG